MTEDSIQLEKIRSGNPEGLNILFKSYFRLVCAASFRILNDWQIAEDMAQEVFLELWKKRESINITGSLKAYLTRAATNKSLNYIRDNKIRLSNTEELSLEDFGGAEDPGMNEIAELKHKIAFAIQKLPERCRLVFVLSRDEEMTYREISEALGISEKTVENQISKALKLLRTWLGPFVAKLLILGFLATTI